MSDSGRLIVCGSPIGNLGDVSDRLRLTLEQADLIYAEDTRRTGTLLKHLGVEAKVRSLFTGNEKARTEELAGHVAGGKLVALISDAGMPTISDPGAEAVRRVREMGLPVVVVPGPSAVTAALALSGFDADRFVFEGFLPRKGKGRAARIEGLVGEARPVVIFASPRRLVADLAEMAAALGEGHRVAITREMTKLHEELWTGTLAGAIAEWTEREPRGEFTIVLAPGERVAVSLDEAVSRAETLLAGGGSASTTARQIAESTGVSRRAIYERLIGRQDLS